MKSNSCTLVLATWLWILAGTLSGGVVGFCIADDRGMIFISIGFILGGMFGGFIARFLPTVIGWQKKGWTFLALILPFVLSVMVLLSQYELDAIVDEYPVLLIWTASGILGSAFFVWIPKWIKRLRQDAGSALRAVVLPLVLIIVNTCFIFVVILGTAAQ